MTEPRFPNRVFVSVEDAAKAGFFCPLAAIEKNLKVFDVRFGLEDPINYGRNSYNSSGGHLPNAIFVDLDTELTGPVTATSGRHPLPLATDFIARLLRAGVGVPNTANRATAAKHSVCLCYDDQCGGLAAARMWWMLNNLGIEAYILDGGIQLYKAKVNGADRGLVPPLVVRTSAEILANPHGDPDGVNVKAAERVWPYKREWTHVAGSDHIKGIYFDQSIKRGEQPLYLDARFALRFNSCARPFASDKMAGHIPNSFNRPWNANIAPPCASAANTTADKKYKSILVLRPTAELAKEFTAILQKYCDSNNNSASICSKRHQPFDEAIFGCASGVTACFNIAVVKHLGFGTPFLYAGSWTECEMTNKGHMARLAHEANGFRLNMIKRANPATAAKVVNPELQLKRDVVGSSTLPDALLAKVAKHIYVGETAELYLMVDGVEVLVAKLEAVPQSKL